MENKLVLLGGGGHCKSVLDAAKRMDIFDEIVITDPFIEPGTKILECEVIGTDACIKKLHDTAGFELAFITVGDIQMTSVRRELADKLKKLGFRFPVIKDPSAVVSGYATIGDGTFIGKNVIVNADARIGEHCIINTGAIVEHECQVDSFSHISVGTILCGQVNIGQNCLIGAGSTIIQSLHIGDNAVVGANSTVLGDVETNTRTCGVVKKCRVN